MGKVLINIKKIHPNAKLPNKSNGNIGWDISCVADEKWQVVIVEKPQLLEGPLVTEERLQFTLEPGEKHLFSTGLQLAPQEGYHLFLWDRSGLAAKFGVHRVAGVIDQNYRGELKVCLINLGKEPVIFQEGDRIVQAIIQQEVPAQMIEVDNLDSTQRGSDGFGSSGR